MLNRPTAVRRLILALMVMACLLEGHSGAAEAQVTVRIDLTRQKALRLGSFEKAELDRDVYFRTYHLPGMFSDKLSRELIGIGGIPGRGTGPYFSQDVRHSYALGPDDPCTDWAGWVQRQMDKYTDIYQKAAVRYPDTPHALAIKGFPEAMRRSTDKEDRDILNPEHYRDFAEMMVTFYDELKAHHCSLPAWLTSQNEPTYRWGAEAFADYTRTLALAMQEVHPEIKVCGPCSAWPYPQTDWRRWFGWEKTFIDRVGDVVGAYDLHLYSKGYWAYVGRNLGGAPDGLKQDHPSLDVTRKTGCATVWDYGRAEGLLDLFAAYHAQVHPGGPKPMIISEFGRQGIEAQLGPWENDFKPWMYMATVVRLWMSFMDRPEVELAIPFILGEPSTTYGPRRGQAVYNRPGAPDDLSTKVTRFKEFYQFFKQLKGKRVPVAVDSPNGDSYVDVRAQAFVDGDRAYVLLHNAGSYPDRPVSVQPFVMLGPEFSSIANPIKKIEARRLRWEGPIPADHHDPDPKGQLRIDIVGRESLQSWRETITLAGEETCLIVMHLYDAANLRLDRITDVIEYADIALEDIEPGRKLACTLMHHPWQGDLKYARLGLGLAGDGGFDVNPKVYVNDIELGELGLSHTRGVKNYHAVEFIDVPTAAFNPGENRIALRFPINAQIKAAFAQGHPKWVTAKLITGWVNPAPFPEDMLPVSDPRILQKF